jgi:hypothetical protein
MPIPPDARQVRGEPNRIQLSDGRIVTRAAALSEGARYMGYRSHFDYRKNVGRDTNYTRSFINSAQGREALAREKQIAASEGRRFNMSQFQSRIVAARNSAHSARGNRDAFLDFMDRYDLDDADEFVDY